MNKIKEKLCRTGFMSRERNRIIQKRESNPIVECNKIQKKFYPELLAKFDKVKDPRHSGYTQYSCREILGTYTIKELQAYQVCRE